MATSGITSWELTRNNIIEAALRKCGRLALGQTPVAEQYTNAQYALNGIVTRFSTMGMPLWKRTQTNVTIVAATVTYTLADALQVPQVLLHHITSEVQYELQQKSKYDINQLPQATTGIPTSYNFTPGLSTGTITIWPEPTSTIATDYRLVVVYQKEFDTFSAAGETPDFPSYWTDALIWELAAVLGPEYGVPLNDRLVLEKTAMKYIQQAQDYGDEVGSIYFQPSEWMRGN